ncbi:DUF2793 domain-containing protein [Microvirga makkahensis]|uniref:DUF2793 domain-containing protein n=1 Tax=Microvirga makkahensis TaxID=1128670 RepID=A0A7X3SR68_9HYPH|nr:DUF2793 domain-containing protein [Microvirga makkahensis]MXQ13849.1 DUF2793 domain-containing protein [Microvirga makkahensis]
MSITPHLALPLLAAAQAQKHVTHNEALSSLDALVHLSVLERERAAPPATPAEGDRYLVGPGGTGAFAGHEREIALFDLGAWRFLSPRPGWRAYVEAESVVVVFDGEQWRDLGHYCRILDNLDRLGIGTAPDDLNRLSAKLNAALFSALNTEEGGTGDLRFVLNKAGMGNVLSQLYQRGFSGRAETGLIGNDDFTIRVSSDGAEWIDALVLDGGTGTATFPQGLSNVPRANLLINASFCVNQRGFAGGALAEGAYGFDRWKAGPGGCTLTRAADGTMVLTGALEQIVEVAHASAIAGTADLAGAALTLSVEDPSEPIPVLIGTRAATIPAGAGRCSVSVVLGETETGHLPIRLDAAAECSFKNVKLELGSHATPWRGEPLDREEFHCRRYYQPLPLSGSSPMLLGTLGQRVSVNLIDIPLVLPTRMRANPALVTSGAVWTGGVPSGNQLAFFSNNNGSWVTTSGMVQVTTVVPASASAVTLRLQSMASFSGTAGSVGHLYLGDAAVLALQAEL